MTYHHSHFFVATFISQLFSHFFQQAWLFLSKYHIILLFFLSVARRGIQGEINLYTVFVCCNYKIFNLLHLGVGNMPKFSCTAMCFSTLNSWIIKIYEYHIPIYQKYRKYQKLPDYFTFKKVANSRVFNDGNLSLSFLTKKIYWCLQIGFLF